MCNHRHYLVPEHSITPEGNSVLIKQSLPIPPSLQPLETTNLLCVCAFAVSGYFVFTDSHALWPSVSGFSHMLLRGLACVRASPLLLQKNSLLCGCITFCSFIHQLMDICFHILSIMNSATMNTCVLVFVRTSVFNSFECIPQSGIAGSYGNSMFNFLKNCQLSTF